MNRLRLVFLASGLISPLAVGIVNPNAGTIDDPQRNRRKTFNESDIQGSYVFSFEGAVIGAGPVAATGVVVADGRGNITSGVRTLNFNGLVAQQTFTCGYSVNANGTGSAVCPVDDPLPGGPSVETFDFALARGGRVFRLLGTTPGITVLGSGAKQ